MTDNAEGMEVPVYATKDNSNLLGMKLIYHSPSKEREHREWI